MYSSVATSVSSKMEKANCFPSGKEIGGRLVMAVSEVIAPGITARDHPRVKIRAETVLAAGISYQEVDIAGHRQVTRPEQRAAQRATGGGQDYRVVVCTPCPVSRDGEHAGQRTDAVRIEHEIDHRADADSGDPRIIRSQRMREHRETHEVISAPDGCEAVLAARTALI